LSKIVEGAGEMKIVLNSKETEIAGGTSVQGLMASMKVKLEAAAVEMNGEIVTRDRHADTVLRDGDRIEIIKIIGGG
jgi:thiamine biosynthesis protein ThiS